MYIYKAKCERVVDGDTIDAIIDLGFDTWKKIRIRLVGINAAESRTRDLEEKARGLAAKQYVKDMKLKPISIFDINNPGEKRNKELLNILNYDTKKGIRQTLECTGVKNNKNYKNYNNNKNNNNEDEQNKILDNIMNSEIYDNDTEYYKYDTYGKNPNYAHLSEEDKTELNKTNKKQI